MSHLHPLMGCYSMPAKLSSSVFIHRVQISNILPSSLTTPSCTILTVLCIWVIYSPLTWMIGKILSESSKILIVKPILYSANFMLLTSLSNVILLNLTVYLCMEPHCGLCHLLHYISLKLLLTKFYICKTWHLSYRSHTGVTHCIARIPTVSNIVFNCFCSFFSHAISSPNIFLRYVFIDSSNFVYSFTGYTFLFGHIHYTHFSDSDHYTARFVRQIRSIYGSYSHCEHLISFLCCN